MMVLAQRIRWLAAFVATGWCSLAWAGPNEQLTSFYEQGVKQYQAGKFGEASQSLQKAIELGGQVFGSGQKDALCLDTARLMELQANCQLEMMEFAKAEQTYLRCITVGVNEEGASSEMRLRCSMNLGTMYSRLHQYQRAEENYLLVIQNIADPKEKATALSNLAYVDWDLGRLNDAKQRFAQSQDVISRFSDDDSRLTIAGNEHGLGMVAFREGNRDLADRQFSAALRVRQQLLPADHYWTAYSKAMLAAVHSSQGHDDSALPLLQQALQSIRASRGDKHLDVAIELHELGLLDERQGNLEQAIAHFDESRRVIREYAEAQLKVLSPEEQLKFMADERSRFMDVAAIALRHRDNAQLVAKAFDWTLNDKGLIHEAMADQELLLRDAQSSPEKDLLVGKLQDTRNRMLAIATAGSKDAAEGKRLQAAEAQILRQIGLRAATDSAVNRWVENKNVAAALPRDAILFEIVRLNRDKPTLSQFDRRPAIDPALERYAAFVLTSEQPPILIDLGSAKDIEDGVQDMRELIQDAKKIRNGEQTALAELQPVMSKLSEQLLRPLLAHIGAKQQIILSADGALWLVPWAALPISETDKNLTLVERYSLRLLISGRDLARKPASTSEAAPVIFADPQFDATPADKKAAIQESLRGIVARPVNKTLAIKTRSFAGSLRDIGQVNRLPGTAAEAAAIQPNIDRLTKGKKTLLFKDRLALETTAKRLARPQIAVFSTHGFFFEPRTDPDKPADGNGDNPLLRCGLLLAGCNQRDPANTADDGILTGLDICGIDFRGTDLIVLSACETGIGKVNNGEGVAGLRQAFQLAGANSVVATLWEVPDNDTALLMKAFFENLAAGQTKAEALRSAQIVRIKAHRTKSGAAHPFFWAAFTLTGQ